MIPAAELHRHATAGGVDVRIQERDYAIAWLLEAAASIPHDLIFKGGTCLRRCYYAGYRYSEDLDFTLRPDAPQIVPFELVREWCERLNGRTGMRATAFGDDDMPTKRVWVTFSGPTGAVRNRAIKVDITSDESVVGEQAWRQLISEYSDLDGDSFWISCYSLAEIWAEKTRSLMQRSEPRDAYDLAEIYSRDASIPIDARNLFVAKAQSKQLDPRQLGSLLEAREQVLERLWISRLEDQLQSVPPFVETWRRVRRAFRQSGYLEL